MPQKNKKQNFNTDNADFADKKGKFFVEKSAKSPRAKKNQKKESSKSKRTYKISIRIGSAPRSPFVVNLKNPNAGFSDPFQAPADTNAGNQFVIPPSPRQKKQPSAVSKVNLARTTAPVPASRTFSWLGALRIQRLSEKGTNNAPVEVSRIEKDNIVFDDVFAPPSHFDVWRLSIPRNWPKKVAVFMLVSCILVLPLQALTYYQTLQDTKGKILYLTNEAIKELQSGQQAATAFELEAASQKFSNAKLSFASAQKEVDSINTLVSELIKIVPGQGREVTAGIHLLEAGQLIAETGEILLKAGSVVTTSNTIDSYFESVVSMRQELGTAIQKFNTAKSILETVSADDLPEEHRETFTKVLAYLPVAEQGLGDAYLLNETFLKILGEKQWKRYLLVFLNNNELRATGGFMGSFAMVDIDRGKIKNMEIPGGGTYDVQGQLVARVIAPEPLHLINTRWEFQDSNWWPDFPTAAKKIEWFYQNASKTSVDGVISVNSSFMEDLLRIFGPIEMPEYERVITAENFELETQKIVELEYDREENRPKKFLGDLAPKLLERMFTANADQMKQLVEAMKTGFERKQLMVYFNDESVQTVIHNLGWSGALRNTNGDFISVVHTNLAGGKTDAVIDEQINHIAEVQADGTIVNTVTITRHHRGIPGENVFTGVQNNSYVRVYVPEGSELIAAEGFQKPDQKHFDVIDDSLTQDDDLTRVERNKRKHEPSGTDIYEERGKTVFGNWLQLKPQQTVTVKLVYRLPFTVWSVENGKYFYSVLAQKQHGSRGSQFSSELQLPQNLQPVAKYPSDLEQRENSIISTAVLSTDHYYGVALKGKQ